MNEAPPHDPVLSQSPSLRQRIDHVCDGFETAWLAEQRPRVEDYVNQAAEPERPTLLRELIQVDVHYRRCGGEEPVAPDYQARFPELAPAWLAWVLTSRPGLPSTIGAPGLGRPLAGADSPRKTAASWPRVDGYDILEEVGHGGMGVVYKARQLRLNRVVALKMILAGDAARPEELSRFRREAEAVAQLQHPHIVQIYEVGEQAGRPFLSLEYVNGGSLAQRLRGVPQPARTSAPLLETLARAVQHAHQRGIIHRDLKPANILLQNGTADERRSTQIENQEAQWSSLIRVHPRSSAVPLVPKIADFGLAKRLDGVPGVSGAEGQTQTGAVLGTPSYMAPEQAAGQTHAIGPAADVYALGAILYELLTGRPPFVGETALDTLYQVQFQEPVPPSRLQPKVPRDLETICLKCLEKEMPRRYPSAEALADDVRRFLAGEPIQARPVSAGERLWRWCRRNPRVAGLVGAVFGLLVLVAVGATAAALWIDTERRRADANYQTAEEQRQRAEAGWAQAETNFQLARQAVDRFFTTVSESQKLKAYGFERLRQDLLRMAKDFYDQFVQQQSDDPDLEAERGRAYGRLARIAAETGSQDEAIFSCRQAVAIFERLAGDHPGVLAYQQALAEALHNLGNTYHNAGQGSLARQTYERVLPLHEELVRAHPRDFKHQVGLAGTLHNLANLDRDSGELARAKASYEKTVDLFKQLTHDQPEPPDHLDRLARILHNLGELHSRMGQQAERGAAYESALAIREPLADKYPDKPLYKWELARLLHDLANLERDSGRPAEAQKHDEKALPLFEELVREHRDVPHYEHDLAFFLCNQGVLYNNAQQPTQAKTTFEKALPLAERLVHRYPKESRYQLLLATTLVQLGDYVRATAEVEAAVATLKTGLGLYNAACVYSLASLAASHDANLPEAGRQKLNEEYTARAIELLRQAVAHGFKDLALLKKDTDLDPLRSRADFQELLSELAKQAQPGS